MMVATLADLQNAMNPQLDLFADSCAVMLRNDLIDALQCHDTSAARAVLAALAVEADNDAALADGWVVIAGLLADEAPFDGLEAALQARAQMAESTLPAAVRVMGSARAAAWSALPWARLARRAEALPFRPEAADGHASPLWLLAHKWQAAAQAVQTIASWRRIPAPLAWMAEAHWHLHGLDGTWPLLTELAWLAPARWQAVAQALPDRALNRLAQRFEESFDDAAATEAWAWLPAWALCDQPLLAAPMATAEPSRQTEPEQGWQLVQALLRLERHGRHAEAMENRRKLKVLHGGLFAAYMRGR